MRDGLEKEILKRGLLDDLLIHQAIKDHSAGHA